MITTCKELAEILMQTPEKKVLVTIDDGTGMECSAKINGIKQISEDTVMLIPEETEIYD